MLLLLPLLVLTPNIEYISPLDFEKVPAYIREEFYEMGCMIPQPHSFFTFKSGRPLNIISGEFAAPGQTDWAAICSRDGQSETIVLWGGPAQCNRVLDRASPDSGCTQGWGEFGMVYSCVISSFPPDVGPLFKMDEGLPERRTHDAINDYFLDKAAVAYYCHEGKWVSFGTAD